MERVRLLLLDDHVLFREGLSRLLASEPDFEVAGQHGAQAEALDSLRNTAVDVVLLDWTLGKEQGSAFITAARRAGYRGRILIVTAGMSGADSLRALHQGVSGIFLKHNAPPLLTKAIRLVAAGEMWVDQRVIQLMAEGVDQRQEQGFRKSIAESVRKRLTDREQRVLRGVADGLTNKSIANEIGVSEGSIKATLQQLFDKTRVRTRSQLVRVAMEGALGSPRKRSPV
ncbi:MAG TPA: response regulator transcription factor [Candidatus Acidoferrales bacterium]|jgi:DNA-binding NarL/FixJ family response regulator|nr:response regulator transcription factor [Candidatus Acidoferrales bacterium]